MLDVVRRVRLFSPRKRDHRDPRIAYLEMVSRAFDIYRDLHAHLPNATV